MYSECATKCLRVFLKKLFSGFSFSTFLLAIASFNAAAAPGSVSVSTPGSANVGEGFNISFGSVSGATNYQIYENGSKLTTRSGGPVWRVINSPGTYRHKVRACDASGCSSFGNETSISVITPIPLPGSVSVSSPSSADVGEGFNISFGSVNGATSYNVYENGALLTNRPSGPVWRVINSAGTYKHKIRACNSSGCGSYSNEASITLYVPDPVPTTPNKPSASKNGTSNSLSWGAVNYVNYYKVQISFNNGAWTATAQYNSTNASWSNLNAGSRAYRVQACNSSGCSAYSTSSNTIVTDQIPASMSAPVSSLSGNDLTLSWIAVSHADYYKIQFRDGAAAWGTSNSTYTSTSKVWPDASPVTERTYRAQACNESGCSDWSAASNTITIDPAPTSMVALVASLVGNDLTLSWSAIATADYYNLQYRDGTAAWATSNSTYTSTSKVWPDASPVTERTYRMQACNESGCSDWSAASNTITIDPAPTSMVAPVASLVGNDLTLSWSAIATADYYNLQYRDGTAAWATSNSTYTSTSKVWPDASPVTERTYRMQACNESGCSDWSAASNTITIDPAPTSMVAPVASLVGNDLTLSWSAIATADYYNLQYRDGTAAWATSNSTYTSTSKVWPDASPVTERTYRMQACNESGCTEWSEASNAVTLEPIPAQLAQPKASVNGKDITLSWVGINSADTYEIEVKFNDGTWSNQGMHTGTSKTWVNLDDGSRIFHVRACNEFGCSAYSIESARVVILSEPSTPAAVKSEQTITVTWDYVPPNTSLVDVFVSYNGGIWTDVTNSSSRVGYSNYEAVFQNLSSGTRVFKVRSCDAEFLCTEFTEESNMIVISDSVTWFKDSAVVGENVTLIWDLTEFSPCYFTSDPFQKILPATGSQAVKFFEVGFLNYPIQCLQNGQTVTFDEGIQIKKLSAPENLNGQ
jgi:hypothetical protein